ncbi:GTP pyrophosphokinase [Burkholderia paludis]|uniref:GTP pyrophosphokinase n=1 Tax=Burkholderia paludis TaxID=1506587 RepID=UPI00068AEF8C|nr:RelA/SpoT domain-containing protein [Burkholderia paludis]
MANSSSGSDIIAQFIARYRREYDFFEQAGRIVAQQLEIQLDSSGIRAMVTSRAKNPKRLETKIRQRNAEKNYGTVDDIYSDIVDLAGVRVALYFPAERDEVDKIVQDRFTLTEPPKVFKGTSNSKYEKRFSGYWATHYRLQIREATLADANKRFAEARVEVQVASVLMHAWSEVEHDLVYKPLQGTLSEDELAILDELNGMMLAGEIALERLQRAAEVRLSKQGAHFENHFDLASFLVKYGRSKFGDLSGEPVIGDVQLLFRLLTLLKISTADQLQPYLASLAPDTERRPLAQQITDQILAADPKRYDAYATARQQDTASDSGSSAEFRDFTSANQYSSHGAIGFFVEKWIVLERFLREFAKLRGMTEAGAMPSPKYIRALEVFDPSELNEIERIRRFRNYLVHGVEIPDLEFVLNLGKELSDILNKLLEDPRPEVQQAARAAFEGVGKG